MTLSTEPIARATATILIVDDDRAVAGTFARLLELEGYAVETASTAEAAFQVASRTPPDAIILDIGTPVADGMAWLRTVRARQPLADIPVAIVTSDYFIPHSLQQELQDLNVAIKYKPLYAEDLVALARKLVSSPS